MKYYVLLFSFLLSFAVLVPVCMSMLPQDAPGEQPAIGQDVTPQITLLSVDTSDGKKVMTLEEWTACAVAYEAPLDSPPEFLKALAVAMRTYAVYHYGYGDKRYLHASCDLCDDPLHCKGLDAAAVSTKIKAAVGETEGEIIYCGRQPINPIMHTSSSVMTEDAAEVLGMEVAYLKSVSTPDESGLDGFSQVVTVESEEFCAMLKKNGIDTDGKAEGLITYISYTPSGRVRSVSLGTQTADGKLFAKIFGLQSQNFTVKVGGGSVTFCCEGIGSGVGMSKYGAYLMAEDGSDYRDILTHYYSGVYIARF